MLYSDIDAMLHSKELSLYIYIYKVLVNIFGGNLLMCFMFCKIYVFKV